MLYDGSCHCGRISFKVEGEFKQAIDCNCSLCRRRGGLLAFVPRSCMKLETPADKLSTYTFNKHVILHHFCPTCGIAPFGEGKARDGSEMAAINLRCLPDFDLESVEIMKYDGKSL